MRKNEKGDTEIAIVFAIALVIVGLMFWSFASSVAHKETFSRWISDCQRLGGQVQLTETRISNSRYECFVNNSKVVVPGYERYQ